MTDDSGGSTGSGAAMPAGTVFDAFISYSQRGDKAVARALRTVIQTIGKPWWKVRSLNVFLDATSLSAAPGLWDSITEKLDRSRYLILLASPEAAASPWVDKEVAHFIGADDGALGRLLIGLTEGELRWDGDVGDFAWNATTPLPPSLRGRFKAEPLWVDLRSFRADPAAATKSHQGFLHAALDLAATIKGVEKADLYSEELRQQRRSLRLAYGAATVVAGLAIGAGIAAWIAVERADVARTQTRIAEAEADRASREADRASLSESKATEAQREAEAQRDEAEAQRAEADRQARIAADNARRAEDEAVRAQEALRRALAEESDKVAATAQQLIEEGRALLAKNLIRQVMPRRGDESDRPLTPAAASALERAVRKDVEQLWTVPDGDNLLRLAVTTDGTVAVTGNNRGMVHFWNLPDLSLRTSAKAQDDVVSGIEISPDQASVLVSGTGVPSVWDIATGGKRFDLAVPDPEGFVREARYSPDGTLIAAGATDNRVMIFDAGDGSLVRAIEGPDFDSIYERATATARENGSGPGAGDEIAAVVASATFRMFGATIDTEFSPDGRTLAVGGAADPEAAIRLYDVDTGALRAVASGPMTSLMGRPMQYQRVIAFDASGTLVAGVAANSAVQVHRTADGTMVRMVPAFRAVTLLMSADGRVLVTGHDNGAISFWCVDNGRLASTRTVHREAIEELAFSADRAMFVAASSDGTASAWRTPTTDEACPKPGLGAETALDAMAPLVVLEGHTGMVNRARFVADDRMLLTVSRDGSMRLWSVTERGVLPTAATPLDLDPDCYCAPEGLWTYRAQPRISFTDDGSSVIVAGRRDGRVEVLDSNGEHPVEMDGDRVAPAGAGGNVIVHDNTGEPPSIFRPGGPPDVESDEAPGPTFGGLVARSSLAWEISPDRRRIAAQKAGEDYNAPYHLLDQAGKSIATLTVGDAQSDWHLFSSDGQYLIARMQRSFDEVGRSTEYFVAVWRAEDGILVGQTPPREEKMEVRASDDGKSLLTFSVEANPPDLHQFADGALYRVNADGVVPVPLAVPRTRGTQRAVVGATVSPGGRLVAAGHSDGSVVVWNAEGEVLVELLGGTTAPTRLDFSGDEQMLAVADASSTIRLFNLATGTPFASPVMRSGILEMRFSPSNDRLFVLTADGALSIVLTALAGLGGDGLALLDWVRAAQPDDLSEVEQRRYGIAPPPRFDPGGEEALAALDISAAPERSERTGKVAECDALASNPYDRYAPAAGVAFETLDAGEALATCADALAEAPGDPATIYHNARLQDRLEHYPEAIALYRRASDLGYGIAMRGISRLLDMGHAGEEAAPLSSADWLEGAARAGDRIALVRVAARKAQDGDIGGAIAYELAAGWDRISGAAMMIGEQLDAVAEGDEDVRKLALFFLLLGQWRADNVVQAEESLEDERIVRNRTAGALRTLTYTLDPATVVAIYRAARDWTPGVQPRW